MPDLCHRPLSITLRRHCQHRRVPCIVGLMIGLQHVQIREVVFSSVSAEVLLQLRAQEHSTPLPNARWQSKEIHVGR